MTLPIVRRAHLVLAAVTIVLFVGSSFAAARHPVATVGDDLDGDPGCPGCPDLAIAEKGLRAISVRFGNGDGTFGSPVDLALKGAAFGVAIGDCDGDGDLDVFGVSAGGRLAVFRNQRQEGSPQTFVEASGSPMVLGGTLSSLLARAADGVSLDLDGDGALDLAAVSNGKAVVTLRGDGSCGFAAPETTPYVGKKIVGIAAGDFDAANGVDLVVAETFGSRAVTLVNDGTGTLGTQQVSSLGGNPTSIMAADLDANGVPDAVATYTDQNGSPDNNGVNVLHGIAGFGLSAANVYGSGGRRPIASVVGDFDGVPPVDVVALNRKDSSLGFLAGLGAATFAAPEAAEVGGHNPLGLTSADFDRDGKLDVIVVLRSAGTIALCVGDGAGAFPCAPIGP